MGLPSSFDGAQDEREGARLYQPDSSNSGSAGLRDRPPSQVRRPPLRHGSVQALRHGSVQASARLRAGCHPSTELRTNGKGILFSQLDCPQGLALSGSANLLIGVGERSEPLPCYGSCYPLLLPFRDYSRSAGLRARSLAVMASCPLASARGSDFVENFGSHPAAPGASRSFCAEATIAV